MGAAGGSFAQGFVNTLIHGQQVMAQIQDRREALELQKKQAAAALQLHDAETQLATRKLRAMMTLEHQAQPMEWPGSEFGEGGSQPQPAMTPELQRSLAADLNPGAAGTALLGDDRRANAEDLFKRLMSMGDEEAPTAASGMAPPPPPPPTEGAPAAAQPAAPAPAQAGGLGPQRKLDKTKTLSMTDDGKLKFEMKVGERNVNFKIDHESEPLPDGRVQTYRLVSNPEDPRQVQRIPVGTPQYPEALRKYSQTAVAWGHPVGTEMHASAVADQAAAESTYTGRALDIAREQIAEFYRRAGTARPSGSPPPQMPTGSPREAAQAEEKKLAQEAAGLAVQKAVAEKTALIGPTAATTEATEKARLSVPEKASPEERKRLENAVTAGDLLSQISFLYKPGYVGPTKSMTARGREITGLMSQEEQAFRTAVTTSNNQTIKDITGAQMSEPEAQRIMRSLPDFSLPAAQFESRLKMTKINQKVIAIRRRQTLKETGVDTSQMQPLSLTTEERRTVAAPIAQDWLMGQLSREAAIQQLKGLAQYDDRGAAMLLDTLEKTRKK